MSTTYAILLPGAEDAWAAASEDDRTAVYAEHDRFSTTLVERGHRIVGGAELTPSREGRTVRPGPGGPVVTEGPYAETVEQLTGFYLVESDDLDDLLEVCGILAAIGDSLEVRACVPTQQEA